MGELTVSGALNFAWDRVMRGWADYWRVIWGLYLAQAILMAALFGLAGAIEADGWTLLIILALVIILAVWMLIGLRMVVTVNRWILVGDPISGLGAVSTIDGRVLRMTWIWSIVSLPVLVLAGVTFGGVYLGLPKAIGLLLFVIPTVYGLMRLFILNAAISIDEPHPIARSWALSKGHLWTIFGAQLVVSLGSGLVKAVISAIAGLGKVSCCDLPITYFSTPVVNIVLGRSNPLPPIDFATFLIAIAALAFQMIVVGFSLTAAAYAWRVLAMAEARPI